MTFTLSVQELVAEAEFGAQAGLLGRHKSWERVRLGDVARVQNGAAFSSRLFNVEGKGLPLVRIRDVGRGESNTYYSGEYESRYLINPGDILVGMDGDFRVAVWSGPQSLLNQRVCRISVRRPEFYEERFLALVLQGYLDAIWEKTSAVTVKHLSSRTVEDIPLPFPPISEQCRIVESLEAGLARVESAQAHLLRVSHKAKVLRRCLEDVAVGGGSTLSASPSFLPRGWRMASVGELCWKIEYGTSAKTHPKTSDSDVPVIRMGNIQDGALVVDSLKYLPEGHPDVGLLLLKQGDVLFNRTNSAELVGKAAAFDARLGDATFASYLIRCRTGGEVEPEWLALVINSSLGKSYVRSVMSQQVGQANVNGKKLAAMPIPLPPLVEQQEIMALLSIRREAIHRVSKETRSSIVKGDALRRAMLTEAFAGRLVPQDPNDEPAAELLARIRAERSATIPTQRTRARRTPKELAAPPTRVTGDDYQQETLPL